jgi:hypothetical protein
MSKYIDWLIPGIIVILVWGAEFQFICRGVFDPLPLACGISLLLLMRSLHENLAKWIAAKYRKRK